MPVSLGEWRVRIGTFVRRRRKEYDYHYYWRRLHNLIKQTKNAAPPEENNNPECNISSRTGSSLGANSSPGNSDRRPASSYNVNLDTTSGDVSNVPSCDVSNSIGNANSQTRSQFHGSGCHAVKQRGNPCDVKSPGHNDVAHSESACAENSGSPTASETNPAPDTTDVQIPVPRPYVEDELDNRHITINLMTHENTTNSTEISQTDRPEVSTSESYAHVHADIPGETDRINRDKEGTSDSGPSGIEDQSLDLLPQPRQETRNIEQTTSSIREVTKNNGSPTYPVLQSGTSSGEADAIKGNDGPDVTNILLLRSGDVERNPGPNDNPGSLTELELYLLADGMDPSDFRKVGLALGFTEAQLSRFEKDKLGNCMQASYQMLCEWRKTVRESKAREILVNKLESIGLVQLANSVQKGQIGDHIPSITEKEIQRVAEDVKRYLTIHLCQIQADPLNSVLLIEFERIFTNLTLMKEDKGTNVKTPLLYDNLLKTKVNGIYPKRLLVEGDGGVGKTTLCAKIAWDWIHGKGYQDFKLVLVVLLREAKDKTVGEVVKSYLPDDNPVTAKQLDKYILSNPNDVFLVLDGLDEFTVDLNSIQQIALITLNRLFKSGTVLITSRQWKSDEIRNNAYLRKVFAFIAVEGFSAENLSSYITKFFHPDSASSEDLNRFISNNDVIRENMAPYPIYTAMLCIMWKEFDGERREAMSKLQTFSQLFDEMVHFLVDHYLSKLGVTSADAHGDLNESRSNIRYHLTCIGWVAFQGLLERRLVFTEDEFQSCPGSNDVGCKVGVLTAEKKNIQRRDRRNNPNSVVQSVQFPHKLFQEYLSGMYLTSLHNSNHNEYDSLIANIIKKAGEYRYLLYFTSAQQKEVGLDIVSRLIASKTKDIDDTFIVDVAYESQDQTVAKTVADHLSSKSGKTLRINAKMQAHTVSGHIFIMNHREADHLIIGKSCGRTASEDLAEFICLSRSLGSVTIASTMHEAFYSVLANKAVDSKIETLDIRSGDLSIRPSASRDFAQFICEMPHLKNLTLVWGQDRKNVSLHDDFYSTSSSMASSAKIETLKFRSEDLSKRPSASRDFAQFICKMPHLKNLTLGGVDDRHNFSLHDNFYSTSSSMASSSKIETLDIRFGDFSMRPSASRDFAQFICEMPHLKNLTLGGGQDRHNFSLHDNFYSTSSSMSSSAKIETLVINLSNLSNRPSASCNFARFICQMPHLKNLKLSGERLQQNVELHDGFYSISSSMASSAKIATLDIRGQDLSIRPSASRDFAQFICQMPHLINLTLGGADYSPNISLHNDFYSTSLPMASSTKIDTLVIRCVDLSKRPSASRDFAQFICQMPHLKNLTLGGEKTRLHFSLDDDFYSTSSSMASSAKIETLVIWFEDLSERPSASRDFAQFICKLPHLKNLIAHSGRLANFSLHDDFYSTSSAMVSSAKIETLDFRCEDLSIRPSASRDFARFICKMPHLKNLTLGGEDDRNFVLLHDDFYSNFSSMASSSKIETLDFRCKDRSIRPSASRDFAQFISKMPRLKNLTRGGVAIR